MILYRTTRIIEFPYRYYTRYWRSLGKKLKDPEWTCHDIASEWMYAYAPFSVPSVMLAWKRICVYDRELGCPSDLRHTHRGQLANCASAKSRPPKQRV